MTATTDRQNVVKLLEERERVRLRPGMFVGQHTPHSTETWLPNGGEKFKLGEVTFIPAFVKLFDEVIGNCIDEGLRTNFRFGNRIDVAIRKTVSGSAIDVIDNGRGIPTAMDDESGMRQSQLACTRLGSGGNFLENNVESIGTNGVGLTCVNFLSSDFELEIWQQDKTHHTLAFSDGAENIVQDRIGKVRGNRTGTRVSYVPDYEWFGLEDIDQTHRDLIYKRIIDLAFCYPKIKFYFEGTRIKTHNFAHYVSNYGDPLQVVAHENENVRFAVMPSEDGFKHVSFVNGLDCYDGGEFVNHMTWHACKVIREEIARKHKLDIRPSDIKNGLRFIISLRMEGAKFDSQSKTRCINDVPDFLDRVEWIFLATKFAQRVVKNEALVGPIIELYRAKEEAKLKRELNAKNKRNRKKSVAKLVDCNSRNRSLCTLYITEGDSATGAATDVRDPEIHAFLPIRGKMLNIWGLHTKDLKRALDNKEVASFMAATGLEIGGGIGNCNYGSIVFLTDQDHDGNCISAQLMSFLYRFWPELFEKSMVRRLLSPLYIVKMRNNKMLRHYDEDEHAAWKAKVNDADVKEISYNKGLGSLETEEYDYMLNSPRYLVFDDDGQSKASLDVVFAGHADGRKKWLMEETV